MTDTVKEIVQRAVGHQKHFLADQIVAYGSFPDNLHYEVSQGYHGEGDFSREVWLLTVVEFDPESNRALVRFDLSMGFYNVDALWERLAQIREGNYDR